MKVTIVGGSAQSTPALWSYLMNEVCLTNLHVVLLGRNRSRLEATRRACRLLADPEWSRISHGLLSDRHMWEKLVDTQMFLVQVRSGGYRARSIDETFPVRHGICGDEGLGPGGLSAGIRNWSTIRPFLQRIHETAPGALVLIMSSPVSLLVRAACQAFPRLRIVGICELPWTTLVDICRTTGVSPNHVEFDYFGLNHMGWFYRIASDDRNVLQEYTERRQGSAAFPSAQIINQCGGAPARYLRLHYEHDAVLEDQRKQESNRGKTLEQLSHAAFRSYQEDSRDEIEAVLAARPTPWYRHAVGPLIVSLMGRAVKIPIFLSTRNDGACKEFAEDDILESAHGVERGRFTRLKAGSPIPSHMEELIKQFVHYERLAAIALDSGSEEDVNRAIRVHPWMHGKADSAALVRDIMKNAALDIEVQEVA